ncbi:unnamed protein product, partial [Sphacelaria rigidula]
LNVILYGECGVGKTSLRNRWVDGVFTGDVAPTFGVDFNIKTLELDCGEEIESVLEGSSRGTTTANAVFDSIGRDVRIDENHACGGGIGADTQSSKLAPYARVEVKINVYDTSGKAAYRTVNGAYLLAFDAVLFVYDVSSVATLDVRTKESNTIARKQAGTVMLLVGNKSDVPISDRQVGIQTGQDAATEFGIPFMEVSAKSGVNVKDAFMSVARSAVADRLSREAPKMNSIERRAGG